MNSKYRLYDEEQLLHLQIVSLLRKARYKFTAILDEVMLGNVEQAVRAAEKRQQAMLVESLRCSAVTTAIWQYVQELKASDKE